MKHARLIVFDGDDTLWVVESLFDEARDSVAKLMADLGLDAARWDALQRKRDLINARTLGVSPQRFPKSCLEAYLQVCNDADRPSEPNVQRHILELANQPYERQPALIPDVEHTLATLGRSYSLVLLTQGGRQVQEKRIHDSGLARMFEQIKIVDKKTEASFQSVLEESHIPPEMAWSVGNSLPSDINPALRSGMSAVWIDRHVWSYERREGRLDSDRLFVADQLADIPALLEREAKPA
jgi:putative hydrolase of the HAD superfamily